MKTILALFFLIPLTTLAQEKAFYKETIKAYELSNNDTIRKKVLVTYLDSLRNVITTENNINNAISGDDKKRSKKEKTYSIYEVNTNKLCIKTELNTNGDTIGKLIHVYDDFGNRIENYQISKRDTVIGQKRTYDKNGNYTELYNRFKDRSDYFLRMEWKYDDKGNFTEWKSYNEDGALTGLSKYKNKYKKNGVTEIVKFSYVPNKRFVKQFKEIRDGLNTKTFYYFNSAGYNYGIKLTYFDGGYGEKIHDDCGKLKQLKLYNNKNDIVAYVIRTEEELK